MTRARTTTAGAAAAEPAGNGLDRRYRFFGGKGGVGKTTCAAGAAIVAAERRHRVLVVSTDPAHSLGDALGVRLGAAPRRIPVRGELRAAELDADRALVAWMKMRRPMLGTIAERGTYLDREDIGRFLGLSLPGVDELIGLLALSQLAGDRPYDDVVVDTAPTGHTLRLLEMPDTLRRIASVLDDMQAKHRFLAASLGGGHRTDAADRLIDEIARDGKALAGLLRDPARCAFAWVLVPERLALEEARDGVRHLDEAGIRVAEIVVNRVTAPTPGCPLCAARAETEAQVVDEIVAAFGDRVVRFLPAEEREPRGIVALRRLGRRLAGRAARPTRRRGRRRPGRAPVTPPTATVPAWLDALVPPGVRLCLVGGKGGVGKSTSAAAIALAIARRDPQHRVLLLSTDPAHSLGDVFGARVGDDETRIPGAPDNLRVREHDANRAWERRRDRYRDAVDRAFTTVLRRGGVDVTFDRTVVRELLELAPPGLDELFGLLAVVHALFRGEQPWDTVVVDTAPTGHTLRLLRMPGTALEWVQALLATILKYRAVIGLGDFAADLVDVSRDLRRLDEVLSDPARTRFIVVTRAAELPRRETERLLDSLRRLDVPAPVIVVNAVTRARGLDGRRSACRRCAQAARVEAREIRALRRGRRAHVFTAPLVAPPPAGVAGLEAWSPSWRPEPER
ncbi:MAG: ArsA family ATPase [Candidatus Rokubacteria bacterium]|nr:ArsA family ATPase [Candidatus Rokubacteria bacterium]